jgi:hypothetical protein
MWSHGEMMQTIPKNKSIFLIIVALAPVLWLVRLVILLFFAVVGVLVIAVLAARRIAQPRPSALFNRTVLQFPRWAWLWNNQEDGVDGLRGGDSAQAWWKDRTSNWSDRKRVYVWSAFRNPVDSLRLVPLLNPNLDPARVRFVGMDHEPAKGEAGWYFAWLAGTPYSCLRVERCGFRFWLGWKFHPDDSKGLAPGDARATRCDFACQLKRVA